MSVRFLLFVAVLGIAFFNTACQKHVPKIPGVALSSDSLLKEIGGPSLTEVPMGSVIEYLGESSPDSSLVKIQFEDYIGWIPRWSVVLKGKAAVVVDGIPEARTRSFIAVDTVIGKKSHFYYSYASGMQRMMWISNDAISYAPKDISFVLGVEKIRILSMTEQGPAFAELYKKSVGCAFLSDIPVDFSEAPDQDIEKIGREFGIVLDKDDGKVIMPKEDVEGWVRQYANDIFASTTRYYGSSPKSNYFVKYFTQLPAFIQRPLFQGAEPMGEDQSFKAYLLYKMDRSEENIIRMYDTYGAIIRPFTLNDSLAEHLNKLIAVHDYIWKVPNYEKLCAKITEQVEERDRTVTTYYDETYEQKTFYEPILDTAMTKTSMVDPYNTYGPWYHSFWVRRLAEDNARIVYLILKDLRDWRNANKPNAPAETTAASASDPLTITCEFQDASLGDCMHIIFDSGDFGDAVIDLLNSEGKELWRGLTIEENGEVKANPIYVGRRFEMTYATITGDVCNEGGAGQGITDQILTFKLLDR